MILIIAALLAFYLAWNLGANDVANAMGTSVGSRAITLTQALVLAGILEFAGATLFGQRVASTLAKGVIQPEQFSQVPQTLLVGMVAVLLAGGLWLNLATALRLPVSSSHAIVGALAGIAWVACGVQAINWSLIGIISLTWIGTPLVSGLLAAFFYALIQHWILKHPVPEKQLLEWVPWFSVALVGIFGAIVLPTVTQSLTLGSLPAHDLPLGIGVLATLGLTGMGWQWVNQNQPSSNQVESFMGRFQVLSAACVAFAHGSNDVGNAIAPLATIVQIEQTGAIPSGEFLIPPWTLILGGAGIVLGLAIWGKQVMMTIGEGITPLKPSMGFCAELATATVILLASRWGLPVSTSHALVGGVVGIGLINQQASKQGIKWRTIGKIISAWFITIPIALGLAAFIFKVLEFYIF
ncbi:MAG: inorganic phosphate transporter [Leptolyngbyaceae cyanobacterium bins.59]|nr:inorganic phosphate transporter [Leptolyngbyaceae cyanobacterium bins.59]